jgi:hypothetical protein
VHFAKQKARGQAGGPDPIALMHGKAEYFATVRSIFDPSQPAESLEVMTQQAVQLIRVISAEFSLDELLAFVNGHITRQENQHRIVKKIEVLSTELRHQHLLVQLFNPLCRRLMEESTPGMSEEFKSLFEPMSRSFVNGESRFDPSFQLMTLLSGFHAVGFNDAQTDAVFSTIKGFITNNQSTVAWQLFLHFCMNVSSDLFRNRTKFFFESGIVEPTFLLQTLLLLEKNEEPLSLGFISPNLNSNIPYLIRSTFLFLAAFFSKRGFSEDFSVRLAGTRCNSEQFFAYLLKSIGERAKGRPIPFLSSDLPIECHMMVCSEIVSFIRICLKSSSAVNLPLVELFDTILMEFSKSFLRDGIESVIGVLFVVGEGFHSLKAQSFAIQKKSTTVLIIENCLPLRNTIKLLNGLDHVIGEFPTSHLIGYPRIPPTPSDYPLTSFRISVFAQILDRFVPSKPSDDFTVLLAALSLFLPLALQDPNSLKLIASSQLPSLLFDIAVQPSYEGQYHALTELIEAAAQYDVSKVPPNRKLSFLVPLNQFVSIGNEFLINDSFYFEATILESLGGAEVSIGLISDDTTTRFHSFAVVDLHKKLLVLNGVEIRDSSFIQEINEGSVIGCLFDHHFVSFFVGQEKLLPQSIPFPCRRFTPILISSRMVLKWKFNFGEQPFAFSVRHQPTEVALIQCTCQPSNLKKPSGNELDCRDYLRFLKENIIFDKTEFNCEIQPAPFDCSPIFATHKVTVESTREISDRLMRVVGQPFVINVKFSPFSQRIGTLKKIAPDGKLLLQILSVDQGNIVEKLFDESSLHAVNNHYFPPEVTPEIFRALSIRAFRYSCLLLLSEVHKNIKIGRAHV